MPRTIMTDEERAAKRRHRAEAIKAKRESQKADLRAEIEKLASKIPPHIVLGGAQTVRAWKDSLDAAIAKTTLERVSVNRLSDALDDLRTHVEA